MSKIIELKSKYESLVGRGNDLGIALQNAVPYNQLPGEHTAEQEEQFLLAFSDFKLLKKLFEGAQATFNGINLKEASPEELKESGELIAGLAELAKELIDLVVEQIGVSKEAVMPAVVKDFERQLELITTVLERAENSLKAATA